jgi:lysophospholipase L1-like esterase
MKHLWSFILVLALAPISSAQDGFFFKAKDRVLFLGDSITEQYQYSTYMELYLTTRFPTWDLKFFNAGIGGDTAQGGANRFQSHVLDEQPTAMTINFGMNDAGYGTFDPNRNKVYVDSTVKMLEAAKKAGIRVALASPNAVDRRIQERFKVYVETQKQFYAPLKDLAAKYGATFVDQYATTRTALEKMEADGAKTVIPYYDGFHTAAPGGLLMAHSILTGLKAPKTVSAVSIDASNSKITETNCKVSKYESTEGVISFDRLDQAIPIAVQKEWLTILPYTNQLQDLNEYTFSIKGLGRGTYKLSIDGHAVAQYTHEELNKGVNLGLLTDGPIYRQGQKVFQAIQQKNGQLHQRFRQVVMASATTESLQEARKRELKSRWEAIENWQKAIYMLAQPEVRNFRLELVK